MNYEDLIIDLMNKIYDLKCARNRIPYDKEKEIFAIKEINALSEIILSDKSRASEKIMKTVNRDFEKFAGAYEQNAYKEESLIREIMQNIVDCSYENNPEIRIQFDDAKRMITFSYNETGFEFKDLISFLYLSANAKDTNATGAFGIGIKGAIRYAEMIRVTSCNYGEIPLNLEFSIKRVEEEKRRPHLQLEILKMKDAEEDGPYGTVFQLQVKDALYKSLKEELQDITCERNKQGRNRYINAIELCFASIKKKDKEISIWISGKKRYGITYESDLEKVVFCWGESAKDDECNKKMTLAVFSSEKSGFRYLIPQERDITDSDMPLFVKRGYDFFSTYELTGNMGNENLPTFFVDIPTCDKDCLRDDAEKYYITPDRKGIFENKREKVYSHICEDLKLIIERHNKGLRVWKTKSASGFTGTYLLHNIESYISYLDGKIGTKRNEELHDILWDNMWFEIGEHEFRGKELAVYEFEPDLESMNTAGLEQGKYLFISCYKDVRRTKYDLDYEYVFKLNGQENVVFSRANIKDGYIEDMRNPEDYLVEKILLERKRLPFQRFKLRRIDIIAGERFNENRFAEVLDIVSGNNKEITGAVYDDEKADLSVCENHFYIRPYNEIISKLSNVTEKNNSADSEVETAQKKLPIFRNRRILETIRLSRIDTLNKAYSCSYRMAGWLEFFEEVKQIFLETAWRSYWEDKKLSKEETEEKLLESVRTKGKNIDLEERIKLLKKSFGNQGRFYFEDDGSIGFYFGVKASYEIVFEQEKIKLITCMDIEPLTFDTLKQLTGLVKPEKIKGELFSERFVKHGHVHEMKDYDLDEIASYLPADKRQDFCISAEKLRIAVPKNGLQLGMNYALVFVDNEGRIEEIYGENEYEKARISTYQGDVFILAEDGGDMFPKEIPDLNTKVDRILGSGGWIKKLYSEKRNNRQTVHLLNMMDMEYRPMLDVGKEEFNAIMAYLSKQSAYLYEEQKRKLYVSDISSNLYGYSGNCSIKECKYSLDVLEAFRVKELQIASTKMKLPMLVCSNCYYEAEKWDVLDLLFKDATGEYTISLEEWKDKIEQVGWIPANLLECRLRIMVSEEYDLFQQGESVSIRQIEKHIRLTPMLAASWFRILQ